MSVKTEFEKLDITCEEFQRLQLALQKEEFRKLFLDYCEEIQDPENRKIYEAEIKQLEAERGVDVTFLDLQPGFVLETSINGDTKCFLNIAKCDKIAAPTSKTCRNPQNGEKGANWSIPYALSPARDDVHDGNNRCRVYDVMFHPEALVLAQKNDNFKQFLIDTACNGIEKEFEKRLDRVNIKICSNLDFKGIQRPCVLRELSKNGPVDLEPSPLDSLYPPKPTPASAKPKKIIPEQMKKSKQEDYCTPKYILKHRRPVDMSEMTYEIDAKLNVTIPKELVLEIELPLLTSAASSNLDITNKRLYFVSEKPAKYKLNIELPYDVNDKEGCAKFDSDKRKLIVTLPVIAFNKMRKMHDFNREDSGVESDIRDDVAHSDKDDPEKELESESSIDEESQPTTDALVESRDTSLFLKKSIKYNFPQHFDLNILDETIAIVLQVRNVDNKSIDIIKSDKYFHIQFASISSGYYPTHYAFYFEFAEQCSAQIDSVDAEAWDNNVVLNIKLKNLQNIEHYYAGLDNSDLKMYKIQDEFISGNTKKPNTDNKQSNLEVNVELLDNEKSIQIEIKPKKDLEESINNASTKCMGKKGKKPNKKRRSYSESTFDDIKQNSNQTSAGSKNNNNKPLKESNIVVKDNVGANIENKDITTFDSAPEDIQHDTENEFKIPFNRKQRSFSESRNQSAPVCKGILKHRSRYLSTMSDYCSSFEEQMSSYSCSIDGDMKCSHSFSDIPEENSSQHGLSESCKKTVRFSDVIKKNVFRLDSSILGRRKINQKKKNKKRALQRRHSEGDSADYEDNKLSNNNEHFLDNSINRRKSSKHDSGLDLSTQSEDNNSCSTRNRIESESSDLDSKNSLMFDIDI